MARILSCALLLGVATAAVEACFDRFGRPIEHQHFVESHDVAAAHLENAVQLHSQTSSAEGERKPALLRRRRHRRPPAAAAADESNDLLYQLAADVDAVGTCSIDKPCETRRGFCWHALELCVRIGMGMPDWACAGDRDCRGRRSDRMSELPSALRFRCSSDEGRCIPCGPRICRKHAECCAHERCSDFSGLRRCRSGECGQGRHQPPTNGGGKSRSALRKLNYKP